MGPGGWAPPEIRRSDRFCAAYMPDSPAWEQPETGCNSSHKAMQHG